MSIASSQDSHKKVVEDYIKEESKRFEYEMTLALAQYKENAMLVRAIAQRKLEAAKALLLVNQPWLGTIMLNVEFEPSDFKEFASYTSKTMGVMPSRNSGLAIIKCVWYPPFILALPMEQIAAVIIHELWHIVNLHLVRGGNLDKKLLNYAQDMSINGMLTYQSVVIDRINKLFENIWSLVGKNVYIRLPAWAVWAVDLNGENPSKDVGTTFNKYYHVLANRGDKNVTSLYKYTGKKDDESKSGDGDKQGDNNGPNEGQNDGPGKKPGKKSGGKSGEPDAKSDKKEPKTDAESGSESDEESESLIDAINKLTPEQKEKLYQEWLKKQDADKQSGDDGDGEGSGGGEGSSDREMSDLADRIGKVANDNSNDYQEWVYGTKDGIDNHEMWDASDVTPEELRQTVLNAVEEATNRNPGSQPGNFKEIIERLKDPIVDWRSELSAFTGRHLGGSRITFKRRSRRIRELGNPGHTKRNAASLAVVMDTSGSISTGKIEQFFAEIESMMGQCRVYLLQWDYDCQSVSEYKKGDYRTLGANGRGGTDMIAPLVYIEENLEVDAVVLFTDNDVSFPSKPTPFPLFYVFAPYGENIIAPDWAVGYVNLPKDKVSN